MEARENPDSELCDGCGVHLQRMSMELQSISRTVNKIDARLFGRGTDSDPGMVVHVDRLLQQSNRNTMWIKAIIGTLVTTISAGVLWAASKLSSIKGP